MSRAPVNMIYLAWLVEFLDYPPVSWYIYVAIGTGGTGEESTSGDDQTVIRGSIPQENRYVGKWCL